MAKIINGSSLALALANYLCTNAYLNDTAQDVLIMVGNWIDEAQEISVPLWIPVSERLLGVFKAVIVWTGYHEIGEAQYNGKHFEWIDDEGYYDYAQVTHWMPLPEPPTRENT